MASTSSSTSSRTKPSSRLLSYAVVRMRASQGSGATPLYKCGPLKASELRRCTNADLPLQFRRRRGARQSASSHPLHLSHGADHTCLAQRERVVAKIGAGRGIDLRGQQEQLVGDPQNLIEEPQSLLPATQAEETLEQPERAGQESALPPRQTVVPDRVPVQ